MPKTNKNKIDKTNNKESDLLSIGKAHCKNKEYKEAIKILSQLLKLNPNNVKCLYYLGRSYNEIDEYDKAIKYLSKAVKLNQNDYVALHWLGRS